MELSLRFGRQQALDRVSLTVRTGDCYGFLGHNGAGKTTAMRIALGLLRPDAGRVIVDGFDAASHPREARARMGGLIEVPGFHPSWPARRNLVVLGRLQGMSSSQARAEADRWLLAVGLGSVGRKPVRAFSQGMRQRLGIAQALLGEPSYVLLDEPTNGLDPEGISEMRKLLRDLRETHGMTVLLSSHQLSEVTGLCNRIGIIKGGRFVLEGEVAALLQAEAVHHRIVADPVDLTGRVLAEMGLTVTEDPPAVHAILGATPPEVVTRRLVEAGCALRVFAPETPTLERVYMDATTGHGPPPPAPSSTAPHAPTKRRAPAMPILRSFVYDLGRWAYGAGAWCLLLAPAILAAIPVHRRFVEHQGYLAEVAQGKTASTTDVTAFEALGIALEAGLPLLAFAIAGAASQSISGERGQGTLRNALLRPLRRWQLGLGKVLSLLVFVMLGYGVLLGAGFAVASFWFDFKGTTEIFNGEPFPVLDADVLWEEVEALFWAPLPALFAYAGLGFLAGSLFRQGATALAVALIAALSLDFMKVIVRTHRLEEWLPSAYLPSPFGDRTSYFQYYQRAVTNVGNRDFPFEDSAISNPILFGTVAFILALLFLSRRSVP